MNKKKRINNNQHTCIFANAKLQRHKNTKCKEQKYKRKIYIMGETSTGPQQKSRACSLQGPLAASPAEIWTRIRWPRLDFFSMQQNISMSLMRLCFFFWGGQCCTVSSKQSSWRNAALGLGKTHSHSHRSKYVLCSLSEVFVKYLASFKDGRSRWWIVKL